jgi:hypothetical protein
MAVRADLSGDAPVGDANLFWALYSLNGIMTRSLSINPELVPARDRPRSFVDPETASGSSPLLHQVLETAIANRRSKRTLGTLDLIAAFLTTGSSKGDDYYGRPVAIDSLSEILSGSRETSLSNQPHLSDLLRHLQSAIKSAEDYEYFISFDERGRIVFRVASVLDDYVQSSPSGLLVPHRAILTHFRDQFGGFTVDEVEELEELINSDSAREGEFQRFFDRHSHFLRLHDYREVYSQITLSRPEPDGPLIPDFLLTDRESQRAAVLDLKLPRAKLVVGVENRRRFSAALMEARQQLIEYGRWFRERNNRHHLMATVGMEVYEPRLIVVIGRSSEFRTPLERQSLVADTPGLTVVTYDDVVNFAKRRRILISGYGKDELT